MITVIFEINNHFIRNVTATMNDSPASMILGFIRRYPCRHVMVRSHGSCFLCLARATTRIMIDNPYFVLEWAMRGCVGVI